MPLAFLGFRAKDATYHILDKDPSERRLAVSMGNKYSALLLHCKWEEIAKAKLRTASSLQRKGSQFICIAIKIYWRKSY